MNKFLHYSFAFLFLFSFSHSFAIVTYFEEDVAKTNITFNATDSVSVSVETVETPNGYTYTKAYMWGGDEISPPKKIIRAITVVRNGQMFFIPLSAYADLGNPTGISLEKLSAHGFRLTINGGDAAGSYHAMLDFKKNEISRRKVVSGEFPKEVWEETTFSFNHLNN